MTERSPGTRFGNLISQWLAWLLIFMLGSATCQADGVLTLGRISDDPKNHYGQLKPLLDYVVPRMADVGIREGRILMARDLRQMASHLRHGRVDWVTETSGMAMQLQGIAAARPLLLTERSGVREYRSFIIARPDSGIRSLADLAGRSIAFEHVASTSAYLVPTYELLAHGLMPQPLLGLGDKPTDNGVGYLFARSETNIAIWVEKKLISAGAVSDIGWSNPTRIPEAIRDNLAIIHESAPLPRGLELVRGDMDEAAAQRLKTLLIDASTDPAAEPALRRFFDTTAFHEIDGRIEKQLRDIRIGLARVRAEVE